MFAHGIASLFLLGAPSSSARGVNFLERSNTACSTVTNTALVTLKLFDTTTVTSTQTVAASPVTSTAAAACLSNAQATSIVEAFKAILTDPDRRVANATAHLLIADEYMETSDSINSLAGLPLGNTTFSGKQAFLAAVLNSPPIPSMTTLDIFHDCSRIAFYWAIASGVGNSGVQQQQEVRGVDLLYLTPDKAQVNMAMVEFNSLAWAKDVGWKLTRPDGTAY